MNLYTGGPNINVIKMNTMNISFQPIAKTGSQASVLSKRTDMPTSFFLFIDYFNIGILMPWRFAASIAIS